MTFCLTWTWSKYCIHCSSDSCTDIHVYLLIHRFCSEEAGAEGKRDDDGSFAVAPASMHSFRDTMDQPAAHMGEFTYPVTRVVGPAYYHIGIVDVLQTYDMKKRAETFAKVCFI
jgi:hypothetical protein